MHEQKYKREPNTKREQQQKHLSENTCIREWPIDNSVQAEQLAVKIGLKFRLG